MRMEQELTSHVCIALQKTSNLTARAARRVTFVSIVQTFEPL